MTVMAVSQASRNAQGSTNQTKPSLSYSTTSSDGSIDSSFYMYSNSSAKFDSVTISPALPAGLSIDNSGNITGTPTAGASVQTSTTYTVTGNYASQTPATAQLNIRIYPTITYKNTGNFTGSINAVHILGTDSWLLAGAGGKITKTTDGGTSYSTVTSGTANALVDLASSSNGKLYIAGYSGTVLVSNDNGSSWSSQTSGTASSLLGICFSGNTGFAVGVGGVIRKTVDGGTNWTAVTSGTTSDLNKVHCIDANTAVAVGAGGLIRRTTDGGANWSSLSSDTTADLLSVKFVNSATGWIVGNSAYIAKSTDGGATWTKQTADRGSGLGALYLKDENEAYIAGTCTNLTGTKNGGTKWYTSYYSSCNTQFNAIGVSGNTGVMVGIFTLMTSGTVYKISF